MEVGAELNLFVKEGAAHVKIIVPVVVEEYDKNGVPLSYAAPPAALLVSTLDNAWKALVAAGYEPSARRQGGGGWGKKPQQVVAVKTDTGEIEVTCPKCKGPVWDNRIENDKREKDGLKRRPDFKCKDKECDGIIWNAIDVIVKDAIDNDPDNLPFDE